jgi:hypothetical protein
MQQISSSTRRPKTVSDIWGYNRRAGKEAQDATFSGSETLAKIDLENNEQ